MDPKQKTDFLLLAAQKNELLANQAYAVAIKMARNQPDKNAAPEVRTLMTELCLDKKTELSADLIQTALEAVERILYDEAEFDPAVWTPSDDNIPDEEVLPRFKDGTLEEQDFIYDIVDAIQQMLEKNSIPNCRPHSFSNDVKPCVEGCCPYPCSYRQAAGNKT